MRLRFAFVAILAAISLFSGMGRPAVADPLPGPVVVAQWHLDEPVGSTTMLDSVGTHNGTISGSVTLGVTPAVSGTAYEFTGANPIVRVPSADDLNPYQSPLTISAWLNIPNTLTAGDYNVLQKGTAATTGGAYKLEIVGNAGSLKFAYPDCAFNSPGFKNRAYGPRAINDDTWHQVECHLTSTQVFVTVDGVSGRPIARTVGSIANTVGLTLGGKPNNTHYFNGRADEICITIG